MIKIIEDLLQPGVGAEIKKCRKVFQAKCTTLFQSAHWCEPVVSLEFLHTALYALHSQDPDWYGAGTSLLDDLMETLVQRSDLQKTPLSHFAFSVQDEKTKRVTRFWNILRHIEKEFMPKFWFANSRDEMLFLIDQMRRHFAELESVV